MYNQTKSKTMKEIHNPQMSYNQEVSNIPMKKFIDMHSSIRYESQMGNQKYDFGNSPYNNAGAYQTISSQGIHQQNQNAYNSNPHLKSVRQNDYALTIDLEQLERNLRFNQIDFQKTGKQSTSCLNSDSLLQNKEQVAKISQKAQQVSDQLLLMRNMRSTLPPHLRNRSNSKSSIQNKSPSMSSASKTRAYMKPTESHKHKSIGRNTSKQRMMEAFEFLESGQKQQQSLFQVQENDKEKEKEKDKEKQKEKDKKRKSIKSGKKTKHQQYLNSGAIPKKNKATLQEFTRQVNQLQRPKSSKVTRVPGQQRKNGKSRLFIDPPQERTTTTNQEKDCCLEKHQRVNSQGSNNQITYNSLTKEQSLEQYVKCRDKYFNMKNQQKSVDTKKKKQTTTTQDLVHQRVKQMQMQAKFQEVFRTGLTKTKDQFSKTGVKQIKTPNQDVLSPKTFNFNLNQAQSDIQKEKTQKDIRNQMGNSYMCSFKKRKSHRLSNTIISPQSMTVQDSAKNSVKNTSKHKSTKRSSIQHEVKVQKREEQEVMEPSIILQDQRQHTIQSMYNEEKRMSDEYQVPQQFCNQLMITPILPQPTVTQMESPPMKEPAHPIKIFQRSSKLQSKKQSVVSSPSHNQRPMSSIKQSPKKKPKTEEQIKMDIMQTRLKFLHSEFGAIIKGYKTRRIFHNNLQIRKIRLEFREIIQFAYTLKKDIEDKKVGQSKELKHLLVTSLKELMHKRQTFADLFDHLLNNQTQWIIESKPIKIQQLEYNNVFQKKDRFKNNEDCQYSRHSTSQSQFNVKRSNSQENNQQFNNIHAFDQFISQQDHQHQASYIDTNSSINRSKKCSSSHQRLRRMVYLDNVDRLSPKQMTFGHNSILQSRNLSLTHNQEPDISNKQTTMSTEQFIKIQESPVRRFNIQEFNNESSNVEIKEPCENEPRHQYLRKSSNSRQNYDPRKSIEREKEAKKIKRQNQQENGEQPESPKIIYNEQPKLVQIKPSDFNDPRLSKFTSTPIKGRDIERIERVSAQRLSNLKEKYSNSKNQKQTPKQFDKEGQSESLPKKFVSKIPRLSCSIERLKQTKSIKGSETQGMSQPQQRRMNHSSMNNYDQGKPRDLEQSFMNEEFNDNRLSSISQTEIHTLKPPQNVKRSQHMSYCSNSSMKTQQIPVVSPCPQVNRFEEKDSCYQVQINPSYNVSEIVSKLQSPQRRGSIPSSSLDHIPQYFNNDKCQMSPIKGTLDLDSDRSNKKSLIDIHSSPAGSLGKHMDEIYQRCSNLKQTQFSNNYLSMGLKDSENKQPFEKQSDTKQQLIKAEEIQLFSPQPRPSQLQVDPEHQVELLPIHVLSTSSIEDSQFLNQFSFKVPQKHEHQVENSQDFNNKLNALGLTNVINERNNIDMFDMTEKCSGIDSTHRDVQSGMYQLGTQHDQPTLQSFRLKPEVVSQSSPSQNQNPMNIINEYPINGQSPMKRAKYSPEKQSTSKLAINKENFDQCIQQPIIVTKDANSRRRSRGERVKRSSQNRQTPKPVQVLQVQSHNNLNNFSQTVNTKHPNYMTPNKPNKTSTLKKFERLGIMNRSNSKSPGGPILDERNKLRHSNPNRYSKLQKSISKTEVRKPTRESVGRSSKSNGIQEFSDQPLNLDLNQLYQRMM